MESESFAAPNSNSEAVVHESAEAQTLEELQLALQRSRDLISALREYSKNLAADLDDSKDQVKMLMERLHESRQGPDEEKEAQKKKLQLWLAEAAAEKEVAMRTAMLAVENRNLKFELESLRTTASSPQRPAPAPTPRGAGARLEPAQKRNALLVVGAAFGLGVIVSTIVVLAVSSRPARIIEY